VTTSAQGKTFSELNELPYNEVGLLLGTSKTLKDHKTENPFWKFRLEAAYRLWKAKKIRKILITGDIGWHGYNEPEDFRDAFLAMGVPDSVLFCDFAGFRTHDSVIRCLKVFGKRKVTIISQRFHNERALYIARFYGLDAVGYNADDVCFRQNFISSIREKLARVLLFLDLYILHTQPHVLGNKVDIG
jgi:SanA protein